MAAQWHACQTLGRCGVIHGARAFPLHEAERMSPPHGLGWHVCVRCGVVVVVEVERCGRIDLGFAHGWGDRAVCGTGYARMPDVRLKMFMYDRSVDRLCHSDIRLVLVLVPVTR